MHTGGLCMHMSVVGMYIDSRRWPHHADLHARLRITQEEAIFFEIIQLPRKLNHSMVYILQDVFANSLACRYIRCCARLLLPPLPEVTSWAFFFFAISTAARENVGCSSPGFKSGINFKNSSELSRTNVSIER